MKSTSTTARAIPATLGPVLTRSMAMSVPVSLATQVSSMCPQSGCSLKQWLVWIAFLHYIFSEKRNTCLLNAIFNNVVNTVRWNCGKLWQKP